MISKEAINQQTWIQTTKSLKLCFIVFADKWLQKGSNKKIVYLKPAVSRSLPVHRVHVLPLSPLWVLQLPVWMHFCLSVLALQQHDSPLLYPAVPCLSPYDCWIGSKKDNNNTMSHGLTSLEPRPQHYWSSVDREENKKQKHLTKSFKCPFRSR